MEPIYFTLNSRFCQALAADCHWRCQLGALVFWGCVCVCV